MKLTDNQAQTLRYVGLGLFIFFLNLLMLNITSILINESNTLWNIAGVVMICLAIIFDVMVIMMGYNIYQKIKKMKEQGLDPKNLN